MDSRPGLVTGGGYHTVCGASSVPWSEARLLLDRAEGATSCRRTDAEEHERLERDTGGRKSRNLVLLAPPELEPEYRFPPYLLPCHREAAAAGAMRSLVLQSRHVAAVTRALLSDDAHEGCAILFATRSGTSSGVRLLGSDCLIPRAGASKADQYRSLGRWGGRKLARSSPA